MKKDPNDIKDDEIRIIGQESSSSESDGKQKFDSDKYGKRKRIHKKIWIAVSVGIVLLASFIITRPLFTSSPDMEDENAPFAYDQWIKISDSCLPSASLKKTALINIHETASSVMNLMSKESPNDTLGLSTKAGTSIRGVEMRDTTINDVPLRIYIPHGARPELHIGLPDPKDPSIIYAIQAADVRQDNDKIIGTFVLRGEPISWGKSRAGFCAIINGTVILGTAASTPYFEKATETGGDFFRQYPIVHKGHPVENDQKNKAIRCALCEKSGKIFIVQSVSNESFHDFTQAVADLGVQEAIYLSGGSAYGWLTDTRQQKTSFGTPIKNSKNAINYLLWRTKLNTR